jgi:hypothetical protein
MKILIQIKKQMTKKKIKIKIKKEIDLKIIKLLKIKVAFLIQQEKNLL